MARHHRKRRHVAKPRKTHHEARAAKPAKKSTSHVTTSAPAPSPSPGSAEAALASAAQSSPAVVATGGSAAPSPGSSTGSQGQAGAGSSYYSTGSGNAPRYSYNLQQTYSEAVAQGLANQTSGG